MLNNRVECCLGDVAYLKNGFAFKSTDYQKTGVSILRISNIRGEKIDISDAVCIEESAEFINFQVVRGDILIAMSGATTGKFGVYTTDRVSYQNQRVGNIKLFSDSLVSKRFVFYFLFSVKREIEKRAYGGAQPNISAQKIESIPLSLPPLPEQHRIVAKIEELFSEIDKGVESLETAKAQLQVYRQALLKHAFEGKLTAQWRADNPDKVVPAEQLLEQIKQAREARYQQQLADWQTAVEKWEFGGKEGKKPSKPRKNKLNLNADLDSHSHKPSIPPEWLCLPIGLTNVDISDGPFGSNLKTKDYVDAGVRVVRLENIGHGTFIIEKETFITSEKYDGLKKHSLKPGDLVFSSFITDLIRVAEIPPEVTRSINKADCFKIRTFGDTLNNRYLLNCLQRHSVYKQLQSLIHGVGRPRVNTTQLKSVVIPLCSFAEQQELIKALSSAMSYINATERSIESELKTSEALRQSILKKAFSGQLIPQDPTDEPASRLLERIKAEKAEREAEAKAAKKTRKPKTTKTTTTAKKRETTKTKRDMKQT